MRPETTASGPGVATEECTTDRAPKANQPQNRFPEKELDMTRLRRLALAVLVGVLATLPMAGSALAGLTFNGID